MIYFCLVPLASLTQAMINRSSSSCYSTMPKITIDSIEYYIIEFYETASSTYDTYRWYNKDQMVEIIGANS